MATLKFNRANEWMNRARAYKIYIDGNKIGEIANGQTNTTEIKAGQYSIVAKIDWCSSQELIINIAENEIKELDVCAYKISRWLMPVGLGIFIIHGIFRYLLYLDSSYYYIIPFIFLLIIIYFASIGRKKYLLLTESKATT